MNAAAPGSSVGEVAIQELFDALGGDGEQCWVEDNEGRVGAEVICSFGWASAAGVMNKELAADAASESGVLSVGKKGNEQQETEGTEQTKRPQLKRSSASGSLFPGSFCYLLFNWLQVFAAGVLAGLVSVLVAAGLDSVLEDLESLLVEVAGAESFLAASLYFSLR